MTAGFIIIVITSDFITVNKISIIIIISNIIITIGLHTMSHFLFNFLSSLRQKVYKGLCKIYRAEDLKERKNCKHHTECLKSCRAFDFSVVFQLLVFQHSDILRIPDYL